MKPSLIMTALVFILLTVVTGYISASVVNIIGVTGNIVTIITMTLLFSVYLWLTGVKAGLLSYFMFVLLGLGSSVITTMLTDALSIRDALIQSIMFSTVLFAAVYGLYKLPKKQQKAPGMPRIPKTK